MDKNKLLLNLKNATLCIILPAMMFACSKDKNNAAAELDDVNTKLEQIDEKLRQMQNQTDTLVMDSVSRDAKAMELVREIKRHQTELNKLSAPKDSVRAKRIRKKITSIRMDSVMNANKIKEYIINARLEEFRKVYKKQDLLRARQDSLQKRVR